MVGLGGLEPPTSRLSGVRSNHLSYKPIEINYTLAGARGFEPLTSGFGDRRSTTELSPFKVVPRAGIEPATRGFSVLCSTN